MRYFEKVGNDRVTEVWASPITQLLSAPMRSQAKSILGDPEISVRGHKEIKKRTREVIDKMLKDIPNTQVYLGNSPVFAQLGRLWKGKGTERTLFKKILSTPSVALSAIRSKLDGGDYYSPKTDSVIIRSNIPAAAAHELGHAATMRTEQQRNRYKADNFKDRVKKQLLAEYDATDYARKKGGLTSKEREILTNAFVAYLGQPRGIKFGKDFLTFKPKPTLENR